MLNNVNYATHAFSQSTSLFPIYSCENDMNNIASATLTLLLLVNVSSINNSALPHRSPTKTNSADGNTYIFRIFYFNNYYFLISVAINRG